MTQRQDCPLGLGVVIDSTRAGRFGPAVARWFAEQVKTANRSTNTAATKRQ